MWTIRFRTWHSAVRFTAAVLLLTGLHTGCKARWDKQYAEAICAWRESCRGDPGEDCITENENATCELGTREQQAACLDLIQRATEDCGIEPLPATDSGDTGCNWVRDSCYKG